MLITLVSVGILVANHLFDLTESFKFTIVVGIGTIASGISAIIMSYSAIRTSQFEAIKEYFLNGDTTEMAGFRKKMYDYENGIASFDEKAAGGLCNYFHFWGMMVQRRYLPLWIFDSASGPSICRLYVIMEDYIFEKRKVNEKYAHHFEELVTRIDKKYGFKKEYLKMVAGQGKEEGA